MNFLSIPLMTATLVSLSGFAGAKLVLLLTEKDYFAVDETEIGRVSNDLIFYPSIINMIFHPLNGQLYEILGRRKLLVLAFLLGSFLTILVPYTAPSVYGWLMIVAVSKAVAFAPPQSHPLITDYVKKSSRGQATAFGAFGAIFGEIMAFGVLFGITASMTHENQFLTAGIFGLAITLLLFFSIKEPVINRDVLTESQKDEEIEITQTKTYAEMSLFQKLSFLTSESLKASKQNILIPLTIIGSGLTKLFFITQSTFLLLWITKAVGNGFIDSKEDAGNLYANIMLISIIAIVIFFPFFGKMADKYPPFNLFAFAFTGRVFALLLFIPLEDPTSLLTQFVLVLHIIFTCAELVITEGTFNKCLPKQIRGALNGIQALFGSIVVLFFVKVGGILFDLWDNKGPYYLLGAMDLAFLLLIIVVKLLGKFPKEIM